MARCCCRKVQQPYNAQEITWENNQERLGFLLSQLCLWTYLEHSPLLTDDTLVLKPSLGKILESTAESCCWTAFIWLSHTSDFLCLEDSSSWSHILLKNKQHYREVLLGFSDFSDAQTWKEWKTETSTAGRKCLTTLFDWSQWVIAFKELQIRASLPCSVDI